MEEPAPQVSIEPSMNPEAGQMAATEVAVGPFNSWPPIGFPPWENFAVKRSMRPVRAKPAKKEIEAAQMDPT